jgi:hypothetical protein
VDELMNYSITDIENALIQRISLNLDYLKKVESLGTFSRLINSLFQGDDEPTWNFPFVSVELKGTKFEEMSFQTQLASYSFAIRVCTENYPNERKARTGENGAYKILADLREALIDENLSLNIYPISLSKESNISDMRIAAVTIFEAIYLVQFEWEQTE